MSHRLDAAGRERGGTANKTLGGQGYKESSVSTMMD